MNDPVAETQIIFRRPDDTEIATALQIGRPARLGEMEWACEVEIPGIDKKRSIRGVDSLHALLLAVDFLGSRLQWFGQKGAIFLSPDRREPMSIAEIIPRGVVTSASGI